MFISSDVHSLQMNPLTSARRCSSSASALSCTAAACSAAAGNPASRLLGLWDGEKLDLLRCFRK